MAIDGFRFLPQAVTVNVGEMVTWTNRDPAQHTATSAGAFDTGVLAMGQSRTVQLNTAGTFEYRCLIHGAMTGTVRVIAQATPTPAPTTARPPTAVPTVAPTPPPTPSPTSPPTTAPPTTAPPTSSPSASPTPAPTTPAPETASPAPPGGGAGPTLAVVAGSLAAGLVGLGVYLARRR